MKRFLIIFVAALSLVSCNDSKSKKDKDTTVYYLIRHAEKDRSDETNRNPDLTEAGLIRANNWAKHFEDINLDAVYSTNYNRTQQTATPTAKAKGLEVLSYNPSKLYSDEFKAATKGKSVLVVGHSNTTPVFANAILGEKKYENMADDDNATLFIVTVTKEGKTSKLEVVN